MTVLEIDRTTAAAEQECAHCGLAVPAGLVRAGEAFQFCCAGCHAAWDVLHDRGLEGYYRLGELRRERVRVSGESFEEYDHPAFHALHVKTLPGGLKETRFQLEGIHCASCVWLVERVPLAIPGLVRAETDMTRALARITWDPAQVRLSEVARFLDRIGYRSHPFRGAGADAVRRADERAMLARIGVAGAIAGNVMMFATAIYSGWFGHMAHADERYLRWMSLVLTTPAVLFPGRVFFRGAWAALRMRTLHMDVPIALALAIGYARGAVNTVTDRGPIYFDGVAMLIFLLLVGRFLQQRAQRSAADAAEFLHALSPAHARVIEDGRERVLPAAALLPGMRLSLRPGDTVAADGVVTGGRSEMDVAWLTGESRPAVVSEGDPVWAGTTNRSSPLTVRVTGSGEATRLARMLAEVERGGRRRAPVVATADRLAGGFVAVVLVLASLTWAYWTFGPQRMPASALDHAIALLIVTCPCALALATPLAVSVAIGRAARSALLIKGGDALESLARGGTLYLDKTGTVTEGRTSLERWDGPDWARPLVLALEHHASHPVADGFRAAWDGLEAPEAREVTMTPGGGIAGVVGERRVAVGSPGFVRAHLESQDASDDGGDTRVLTPVWVAVDGRLVARAGFGDRVRADARTAIDAMRARGWRVALLSGDHPDLVAHVGRELGFAAEDVEGGAGPERKCQVIEAAAACGTVVMAGDGINDAAAIARATVGIGVRGGAEACLAAADVFVARPGLAALEELVAGSERTLGVIRRNIAFSLVYNTVGAVLAMSGRIDPLLAAILMPLSSLTVVLASWHGRTFDTPRSGTGRGRRLDPSAVSAGHGRAT
jgi:Cu2+-exporting ATPase